MTGPARTPPVSTARSRIWLQWWFTGYRRVSRLAGSSLPNAANPFPPLTENVAPPS